MGSEEIISCRKCNEGKTMPICDAWEGPFMALPGIRTYCIVVAHLFVCIRFFGVEDGKKEQHLVQVKIWNNFFRIFHVLITQLKA